jgi:hypothetical protein
MGSGASNEARKEGMCGEDAESMLCAWPSDVVMVGYPVLLLLPSLLTATGLMLTTGPLTQSYLACK